MQCRKESRGKSLDSVLSPKQRDSHREAGAEAGILAVVGPGRQGTHSGETAPFSSVVRARQQ